MCTLPVTRRLAIVLQPPDQDLHVSGASDQDIRIELVEHEKLVIVPVRLSQHTAAAHDQGANAIT